MFNTQKAPERSAPLVKDVAVDARSGDMVRRKIIVLPFLDSQSERSKSVTDVARAVVVGDLSRTGQFVVVNNNDFPQDLIKFQKGSEYDLAAISKLTGNMGIAGIVEGKVMEVRARKIGDEIGVFRKVRANVDVTVQIRVFGNRTNKEVLNTVRKATVESETTRVGETSYSDKYLQEDPALVRAGVKQAFAGAIPAVVKAMEKLSWEGRIAMVSGDRIYVNAGRLSGLQIGDVLKIVEDGSEIFDPETGGFIGIAPGRMKGTVEIVSYFGTDGAISVIHSGSGFKENDKVELY
jgi:hypothetical protein